MLKISRLIIGPLLVIVMAVSFAVGFTLGRHREQGLDNVTQVWNIIRTEYVDPNKINTENISTSAIEGILKALDDPYTAYLDAETFELGFSSLEGEFSGIGAYVGVEDSQLTIIAPIADSPADKAGIKAGDIVLEINGQSVVDMSLAVAIVKIRGPEGTSVKLLVRHKGETEPVEIEITRSKFEVPSVIFEMKGDFAYIKLTQFSERTDQELTPVIQNLPAKNARGIILDMRGNPGGLLDVVTLVASHFLSEGTVVEVRSNAGKMTTYQVIKGEPSTDLPIVVLVDDASASGSEVLAGALQDHGRATIAGTTTFGKGSVNILRQLDDGSGLYITIARWLTPNGRLIEGQGIKPDYPLVLTGDDAINWAIEFLTSGKATQ
jgi:carboxyl-terminal processing protease